MNDSIVPLSPVGEKELQALLQIWEQAVQETHTFLSPDQIQALKPLVKDSILQVEKLFCLWEDHKPQAWMGVEKNKLEMLFVRPSLRGKGLGKQLLRYGIHKLQVTFVDVNVQNPQALGFYEHLGFRIIGRSAVDGQGQPFPLFHLQYAQDCP